jgi:hypothetical protein
MARGNLSEQEDDEPGQPKGVVRGPMPHDERERRIWWAYLPDNALTARQKYVYPSA